jgi:D-glycero-D-manno-heptose 1,7-bisphosphate phosphatase
VKLVKTIPTFFIALQKIINHKTSKLLKPFIEVNIAACLAISIKQIKVNAMFNIKDIDTEWTLFLDRDGVINHEKTNDYIHTWDEFVFYDGVLEAFEIFAKKFTTIVVITNQKGVGKGVTKENDLLIIHENMKDAVEKTGGRIEAIYYCKDIDSSSYNRKPNAGMGIQAVKDFAAINLEKSLMIGNTMSDMQFGRNLGVYTIFLPTNRPEVDVHDKAIDAVYPSLIAFAKELL